MANTPVLVQGISDTLAALNASIVNLKTVAAGATNGPVTTIQNRGAMTDLTQDLLPRFGLNRIMTQNIQEVQGEYGANGERVFKHINDRFNQIRYVGDWSNTVSTGGQYLNGPTTGSGYCEITFLGTGLNLLVRGNSACTFAVDGGSASSVTMPAAFNSILDGRNYNSNVVIQVVKGLTFGVHTVKIVDTAGSARWSGFEIINETSTLQYPKGSSFANGAKLSSTASATDAYNSGFQSGSLNATYGGHVLVYQNANGQVQKAIQSNSSGPLYLNSANHANESVIRMIRAREFGSGQGATGIPNDYSLDGNTSRSRFFTLSDGSTNLNGSNQRFIFNDALGVTTVGDTIQLGFIGTGIDAFMQMDTTTGGTWSVQIDATTVGSITATVGGQGLAYLFRLASGLAYGYHILRLTLTAGTSNFPVDRFVVYGPSLPALPTGAVALADYYLLGSYVAASGLGGSSAAPSQGTIFKSPARELIYNGTWSANPTFAQSSIGSCLVATATIGDYMQYTFFGTGVELHLTYQTAAGTWTIQIDGSNYTGAATVNATGGATWTPGTSAFVPGGGNGATLQITGLSLGVHTIRATFSIAGTGNQHIAGVSVITPVHSWKSTLPGDSQNELLIGSQCINDARSLGANEVKSLNNWGQAIGVTSQPTTSSSALVPVPDMQVIIKTTGNPIDIYYSISTFSTGAGGTATFQLYVDGVAVGTGMTYDPTSTSGFTENVSNGLIVPVGAGTHVVMLTWAMSGGTLQARSIDRTLKVREIGT